MMSNRLRQLEADAKSFYALLIARFSGNSGRSPVAGGRAGLSPRSFDVTGAVADKGRGVPAKTEFEDQAVGRAAPDPHEPDVQAALVVEGAERDAIFGLVGAAGGAEPEVMIVQVPPRSAAGHSATVAVPLDHRIGTACARIPQRPGQERALHSPSTTFGHPCSRPRNKAPGAVR